MTENIVEWTQVKNLIQSRASIEDIRQALLALQERTASEQREIENIRLKGWNLMHWAVVENRTDVMVELFNAGVFLDHFKDILPYLHVACALGHTDVVRLLTEKKLEKSDPEVWVCLPLWKEFTKRHPWQVDDSEDHKKIVSLCEKKEDLSALEVCALYQKRECALILLTSEGPQMQWIRILAENDQAAVVLMLLSSLDFDQSALDYGFKGALSKRSTGCLEVLLEHASRHSVTFSEVNPFHFLYAGMDSVDCNLLGECNCLLLNYGYDVNALSVPASYPLYSLIWLAGDINMHINLEKRQENISCLMSCFHYLLLEGADPNFVEKQAGVMPESESPTPNCNQSSDFTLETRPAFCSAVDVLLSSMPLLDPRYSHHLDFVSQCVDLLVEFKCNMLHSVGYTDAATQLLTNILIIVPRLFAGNYLKKMMHSLDETLSTLLSAGANLQNRSLYNQLPLTCFFEQLVEHLLKINWQEMGQRKLCKKLRSTIGSVVIFIPIMKLDAVYEVVKATEELLEDSPDDEISLAVKNCLQKELHAHLKVRSLYHSCLVLVWYSIGRNRGCVESLEVAACVKEDLLGLFTSYLEN